MPTRHAASIAVTLFLLCSPCGPSYAEDWPEPEIVNEVPEEPPLSCFDEGLAADVRILCDTLGESTDAVMGENPVSHSRAPRIVGQRPPASGLPPVPSLARRPISSQITTRGLASPDRTLPAEPLARAEDRGLGVRVSAADTPVQFYSEMVTPEDPGADPLLNWQLKAETGVGATRSGMFWGTEFGGVASADTTSESLSGFVGLRRVTTPLDNVQVGSEITPRFAIADLAGAPTGSVVLEPKLTTRSEIGRLGNTDFGASMNFDLGYRVPVYGVDAGSTYGAFRLTVKPKD